MSHQTGSFPIVTGRLQLALASAALLAASSALAQDQVVKPPIAQYWMDVATISMAGMDDMPDMGALGGMMGGMMGGAGASFGSTRGMMPGHWLDLAVRTQRKPDGTEATQAIPPGQGMGASLTLLPVRGQPRTSSAPGRGQSVDEVPTQPKGRILMYWGCSDTVRAGQPRIMDFSKAGAADFGQFMMGRATRDDGAKAIPGHSVWPNEKQRQKVPANASLVGQHAIRGEGLPASLQFAIGTMQDFMPKMAISSQGSGTRAITANWQALPSAQAYFLNAMSGGEQGGETEMVLWSSSDLPEAGWGLMDYASNTNVAKWLKEKVLLPASQTQCAIPAGIFAKAQGAMLRGIAYGQELNLAHPPRPTDKRIAWEPEWTAKIRVKSLTMVMLGEEGNAASRRSAPTSVPERDDPPDTQGQQGQQGRQGRPGLPGIPGLPDVGGALKGLFGR